jgi:cell fate (sporulation/competence/biofilm development) regulator YlbF (YheA/YmcA/DUF963 family)
MNNEKLMDALDALIGQLKETEEFIKYKDTFSKVVNDEHAMECIASIRELSMRVQDMSEDEYDRESENISARMEDLCADSRVSDFITAEVEFSRLYQYITDSIVSALD